MNPKIIPHNNTNSSSFESQYDSKFYLLAAAGVAGLLGGMYCIYSLLADENDLDDKELIEIEELKHDVESSGKITSETAIHIMYLTNRHGEEELKRIKPDIGKRRIEALNDPEAYQKVCSEYMEAREQAYTSSANKILSEFNTTSEALQDIISKVDPSEMEKKYFELEKPNFDNEKPDAIKSKEAFLYYGNKFIEEMQGLSSQFRMIQQQFRGNPQEAQEMAMFSLFVSKMKVEDMLQVKYKITETQIRFLLLEHNLLSDRDIQMMNQKISSFEEMMG